MELNLQTPSVFEPLLYPSRYKGAWGGRGSGKSHFFAELLVERCLIQKTDWVCIREVQKSLRDSAKKLLETKIQNLNVGHLFEIQKDRINTPYGGQIIFQGMQDHTAETIKSLEGFDGAWCEESQTISDRSLELLRPTIRKPGSELWFSWNPKSKDDAIEKLLRGINATKRSIVVNANWSDNPWFPPELEEERIEDYANKPLRYDHIWEGAYQPEAEDAMWSRQTLDLSLTAGEGLTKNLIKRIVVGVDPAGGGGDEIGIVAVAELTNGNACVLGDYSMQPKNPAQWGSMVAKVCDGWNADCVVAEKNFGGDLVLSNLRACGVKIRVKMVHAARGKAVRAEPIAGIYDQGKVWHRVSMPHLEAQYLLMTPKGYALKNKSPDRLDAAIWALTEIFGRAQSEPTKARVFKRK